MFLKKELVGFQGCLQLSNDQNNREYTLATWIQLDFALARLMFVWGVGISVCNEPLKTCTGVMFGGNTCEHIDGRRN